MDKYIESLKQLLSRKPWKYLWWAFGTVVIGALGSGFWEKVLNPFLNWFIPSVFSLAQIISRSYGSTIIREVAKGFHEAGNLYILEFVLLFVLLYLSNSYRTIKREFSELRVQESKGNPDNSNSTQENAGECLKRMETKLFKLKVNLYFLAVIFSVLFFQMVTINYLATNMQQKMRIIRPYVSEMEFYRLESDCSAMRDIDDYKLLNSKITSIAQRENLNAKLP